MIPVHAIQTGNWLQPKRKVDVVDGWKPVEFSSLKGWDSDDHQAALACFRVSARGFRDEIPVSRENIPPEAELLDVASKALDLDSALLTQDKARAFFEDHFMPMVHEKNSGFVTAYFEPEVSASRTKTSQYSYPLYRRPKDLVKIDKENPPTGVTNGLEYAREIDGSYTDFYDRGEIDNGALASRGLELFWLKSAVEAFYIHVQGSARLILTDGTSARVSFAGKTGHPYSSIGKLLVSRGVFTVEDANMVNMRKWLDADLNRAMEVLHHNRSYIFFVEVTGHDPDFGPVAAAGIQLTPGRSLAVDRFIHPYGTPVWLSTQKPLPSDTKSFQRLMIAQDTGSAILGPGRGDIFIGSGQEAGLIAGSVRHDTDFVVLKAKGA